MATLLARLTLLGLFAVTCRAEVVSIKSGSLELTGDLIQPMGCVVSQAALLLPGSGPARVDDAGPGRPLYRDLAAALLESGFAVLTYDKRGVGRSEGSFAAASLDDEASDASAALRFLRARLGPGARLGLVGHSEGGLVAGAAVRLAPGQADFLVLLCSPAAEGATFIAEQQRLREERAGYAPERIATDLRYVDALLSAVRAEADDTRAAAAIWRAYRALYPAEFGPNGRLDPVRASQVFVQIQNYESPWTRSLLRRRPLEDLAGYAGPILGVWSEGDDQVAGAANALRFRHRPAARPSDTILEASHLDHFLRATGTSGAAERERLWTALRAWLRGLPPR